METCRLFLQVCSICPFSLTLKRVATFHLQAGAIEGQVVEMGLMTTSLLSAEKFPIVVPNSLFSSQVDFFLCSWVNIIILLYHSYLFSLYFYSFINSNHCTFTWSPTSLNSMLPLFKISNKSQDVFD